MTAITRQDLFKMLARIRTSRQPPDKTGRHYGMAFFYILNWHTYCSHIKVVSWLPISEICIIFAVFFIEDKANKYEVYKKKVF